jgi:hypothetical protein
MPIGKQGFSLSANCARLGDPLFFVTQRLRAKAATRAGAAGRIMRVADHAYPSARLRLCGAAKTKYSEQAK